MLDAVELSDGAMFVFVVRKQRILNRAFGAEIGQFLGELLDQLRWRAAPIIAEYLCELKRVHHGLSARVIVGEDERGRGMLLDVLDALLPLL